MCPLQKREGTKIEISFGNQFSRFSLFLFHDADVQCDVSALFTYPAFKISIFDSVRLIFSIPLIHVFAILIVYVGSTTEEIRNRCVPPV